MDVAIEIIAEVFWSCRQAFSALLCRVRDPQARRLQRRAAALLVAGPAGIAAGFWLWSRNTMLGLAVIGAGIVAVIVAGVLGNKVEKTYLNEPPPS